MSKAEVMRRHREAAHVALYGEMRDLRRGAPGDGSKVSRWIETGEPIEQTGKHSVHQAVAQAIADAEQRGRDAATRPSRADEGSGV